MAQGPEKKFKAGAITATIWKNQIQVKGNTVETRSVQLQRAYQDKDGNWQNTNSLQANDLPKAILLLQKAYEHIIMKDISSDDMTVTEEQI